MCTSSHKNKHTKCHEESPCRHPGYSPTKLQFTDPAAIQVYEKILKAILTKMQSHIVGYVIGEMICTHGLSNLIYMYNNLLVLRSFLDQVIQRPVAHLPSQTDFGSTTFKMRMNLAAMDWVCCSCNCVHTYYIASLMSRMKMYKEPAQVSLLS